MRITTEPIGGEDIVPWYYRLLPIVVLIAVMMGGIFIPATSLIDDKQRRTYQALLVTPATVYEVIWSKMLLGGLVSFLMGLMILALNRSLSVHAVPLISVLAIIAMSASCVGSILGVIAKDMKSVTTIAQSLMLLTYAPAILNLFPKYRGGSRCFSQPTTFSPITKDIRRKTQVFRCVGNRSANGYICTIPGHPDWGHSQKEPRRPFCASFAAELSPRKRYD